MPDAPTQPNSPTKTDNQPAAGTTTPAEPAKAEPAKAEPPKATGDFDANVLENPELWKQPRLKELLEAKKERDKLLKSQSEAEEKNLTEQKKFEELAAKKTKEVEELQSKLKEGQVDQSLSGKLNAEGVVDVDGALKLIDRSKVEVDENGNVKGVDEAVAALKTDKAYLFNKSAQGAVGSPTNPGNGGGTPSAPTKFKRSQIAAMTTEEYAKNRGDILKAQQAGLIEDDM